MGRVGEVIARVIRGGRPDASESLLLAGCDDLQMLTGAAATVRDQGHPTQITYSPKVFISFITGSTVDINGGQHMY